MAIIIFRANRDGLLGADSQFNTMFTDTTQKDNIVELIDASTAVTDPGMTLAAFDPRGLNSMAALKDAAIDALELTPAFVGVNQAINANAGVVLSIDTNVITNKNQFVQALDALRRAVMGGTTLPAA